MRTNEKVIKEISVGNENIPISAKYIGNYEIGDIKDMIDDSKYTLPTATDTTLGGVNKGYTIPYIIGSSSDTAGVWTGSCSGITSYKDGLTIIYVPQKAGSNNGTTLNINNLGAKVCHITNTSNLTTHFSAGTPILLTYVTVSGTGYWKRGDYDSWTPYTSAYCTTGGSTAAKSASLSNYVLTSKTYTFISISNDNTYKGALTLNINGRGAKPIYINGSASSASNYTLPAGTYIVYYDGAKYHFRTDGKLPGVSNYSLPTATSSTLGGVKIGSNISVSDGTISLTKSNVTTALGYTPPTTNTTYSTATTTANGLMSKTTAGAFNDYGAITFLYDTDADVTPNNDGVNVNWNIYADGINYLTGEIDSELTLGYVDFTIPLATTTTAGVMSAADKTKLNGIATGATANTGTVTSITIGKGLTGGTNGSITTSGTIKCNLNSETSLGTIGSTSKLYAVGVDANNKLCVNVPWTDNNTTYSVATTSADGLLSKSIYSRMMGPSGWIITDFQDDPISIKQSADNVELKFSLSANRTKLGDGDTDDDTTVSRGTTTIPAADTSKAGLMSAADKVKLNNLCTIIECPLDFDEYAGGYDLNDAAFCHWWDSLMGELMKFGMNNNVGCYKVILKGSAPSRWDSYNTSIMTLDVTVHSDDTMSILGLINETRVPGGQGLNTYINNATSGSWQQGGPIYGLVDAGYSVVGIKQMGSNWAFNYELQWNY